MDQEIIEKLWILSVKAFTSKKLNSTEYDYLMQIYNSVKGLALIHNVKLKEPHAMEFYNLET